MAGAPLTPRPTGGRARAEGGGRVTFRAAPATASRSPRWRRRGRPPRRAAGRAIALAVALAATGCVDFTELTVVGGQEPARLQLTLRLVQDSTVCRGGCVLSDGTAVSPGPGGIVAWFDARLRPGADAGGVPRGVADETLVVLGRPFEPVDRSLLGERRYEGVLALEEAGVEEVTLTFTPPEVEGVGARIPAVRWRVPGALGPDTLIVRPGEDLTLRLAMPAQESEPPFQFGTWAVAVAGQPPLRISSTGAPPEEVRIPHYYLPEAPALFPVLFDIFTGATFFPDPGDYVVAVVVDLKLDWTVRLAADTAASAVLPPTGMPAWTTRTR